ncbi:heterocycloanthracin/sonorensin family bacteriocin [Staphylococcus delphini]|uniref:heterocycloanthracin/sonorensin family bacteriocin n=1 Tax=Staphylococcus delphini TaxID=53344 RepID=UPI000BBC0AFD|nr:heterocycloanthracin/sonorensin family bacteriocin [Staphylococcus delphini]PCF49711.1 hypothetical protein B5C09_00460 [Staphylococcus delphini]PCF76023.1 hypothetical protein B4W71_03465 [Staphylococcus delphini]
MSIRQENSSSGCSGCFGCLGCFGCFGIVLLIILLFSGCSALFGNSDEDNSEDTNPKTEVNSKKDEKTSIKEEKESAKEDVKNDNTKVNSTVEKNEVTSEDDTVYGKLTAPHDNKQVVVVDNMTYILGDNDEILQAEKGFSKLPLDKNLDKNLLNEHAKDYMAKDAEFVSNISDTEQKYHSKSLNKDYYVTLVLNEHGKVNRLVVSSVK